MISVIIPVYNEEKAISQTLDSLFYNDNLEVIVVDGSSLDRTVELAKKYPVKIIRSIKNRAAQMNTGVEAAGGDAFLFLHADCFLDKGAVEAIEKYLSKGYVGGCFSQKINSNQLIYRFIELSGNIRAKLFKIFYGDQAIFVSRDAFFRIGGFERGGLFEDILFSKKLRQIGRVAALKNKIYTSPRRWEVQGKIKATLINWFMTLGFWLRISPVTLKRIYLDIR